MKVLAKDIAAGLAFLAIGVAPALAVVVVHDVEASPDPGVSYVCPGLSPAPSGLYCYPWAQFAGWHPCWHDDEIAGEYTAIDYSFYYPDDCTDEDVWLDYTGDFQLFKMAEYTGYCTGIRAKLYEGSYAEENFVADINYLHIEPNEYWLGEEVPYQLIYIGDVLEEELDPDCPWDGPHLHQSARITAETPFYSNKLEDPTEGDNWVHAIMWEAGSGDEDGDDFTNANELYIGTDPYDDCPDGTWDHAWPPDINNDTHCNIVDVVLFKPHLLCNVGEECYDNRFDLAADGDVDIGDILKLKPVILTSCPLD